MNKISNFVFMNVNSNKGLFLVIGLVSILLMGIIVFLKTKKK